MNFKLNKYKEYRNHKLNTINKRILKCYNIINNFQKGGMPSSSSKKKDYNKDEIDNIHDNIMIKLKNIDENIKNFKAEYNSGLEKLNIINRKFTNLIKS